MGMYFWVQFKLYLNFFNCLEGLVFYYVLVQIPQISLNKSLHLVLSISFRLLVTLHSVFALRQWNQIVWSL